MEFLTDSLSATEWAMPIGLIVSGFLLGLIFEKILIGQLERVARKTAWKGDDIIVASLHGVMMLLIFLSGIYAAMLRLPLDPAIHRLLVNALVVILILALTVAFGRMTVGFVQHYAKQVRGTSIFANITRLIVFILGFLIVLQTLGISITPILTALGVGGLAVALALQETLSNLFSGLHILASRKVRPGDYVELESGEKGYVEDINWRNTTIRALPNNMVIVPNAKLASSIVTNYDLPEKELSVRVQVGVSYASDLDTVERVTLAVAKEAEADVNGGVPEFAPMVFFHTFDSSSINFTVVLRAKEFVDQYVLKHEFIKRLHKRYKTEGIEIPFPIRTVHLTKES